MSWLKWTRVVGVSVVCLGLATACGARRPREADLPTLVPTLAQPSASVIQPTLPPAWTATPDGVAAAPAAATAASTPSAPPAAATASPSDQAGDALEQLLDELGGQLDQTDTLQDANDLIP